MRCLTPVIRALYSPYIIDSMSSSSLPLMKATEGSRAVAAPLLFFGPRSVVPDRSPGRPREPNAANPFRDPRDGRDFVRNAR